MAVLPVLNERLPLRPAPMSTQCAVHANGPTATNRPPRRPQPQQHQINLRLILVSGKTREFLFSTSDSASDVAQHVFEHWPREWLEEAVPRAEILRLIYQGRFLHGNVTLGGESSRFHRPAIHSVDGLRFPSSNLSHLLHSLAALQLPPGRTCVMHLVPRENLPEPNSQGTPFNRLRGGSSSTSQASLHAENASHKPTSSPFPRSVRSPARPASRTTNHRRRWAPGQIGRTLIEELFRQIDFRIDPPPDFGFGAP